MAFIIKQGEYYAMALEAAVGDVSSATLVSVLKKTKDGVVPSSTSPVLATFTVVPVAEVKPGRGPGWKLSLTASITNSLKPGEYIGDGKITFSDGTVDYTDPFTVEVKGRITP